MRDKIKIRREEDDSPKPVSENVALAQSYASAPMAPSSGPLSRKPSKTLTSGRCEICRWQKKGNCGTWQAITRCLRHPNRTSEVREVPEGPDRKIPGNSTRVVCEFCGRNYKNKNVLRTHWYTSCRTAFMRAQAEGRNPSHSVAEVEAGPVQSQRNIPSKRRRSTNLSRSNGQRCASCIKSHQGRCGTMGAHPICERKPMGWSIHSYQKIKQEVAREFGGRGSRHSQHRMRYSAGSNGGPRGGETRIPNPQSQLSFFAQFIATL
ncbi:hypothetical protein AAMO2058_001028800, partial [Amorphochlora amoebiformis]